MIINGGMKVYRATSKEPRKSLEKSKKPSRSASPNEALVFFLGEAVKVY